MCSIAGFNFKDKDLIVKMNKALYHRGPDDTGVFTDEAVSLGANRLSILDPSPAGHQPMTALQENLVIVYNGEIYNFKELRNELKDKYDFHSNSDTEVILAAYQEWGEKCSEKLNGMWAFCIYDRQKQQLFLSRDRFGKKPLYYFFDGNRFVFASEIKAVLLHDVPTEPNDKLMYEFLLYGIGNYFSETFFSNIFPLEPGHNLVFDLRHKKLSKTKHYDFFAIEKKEFRREAFEDIRKTIFDSVKLRLRSDVEVGILLSGGLDSSTIAMALKALNQSKNMRAFCFRLGDRKYDEDEFQQEIIEKTGIRYFPITSTLPEIIDRLPDTIYAQESPVPTSSICGIYLLMEFIHRQRIKVVLDGTGGDEIFAGYPIYHIYWWCELLGQGRIWTLGREITGLFQNNPEEFFFVLKRFFMLFLPKRVLRRIWRKRFGFFLNKEYENVVDFGRIFIDYKRKNLQRALLEKFYDSLVPILKWVDKNSMAFSIEARCPLLDYRLVETALSSDRHIVGGIGKYSLRTALKDLLPSKIRDRIRKKPFPPPDGEIFRTASGYHYARKIFEDDDFRKRKYWDAQKARAMLEEHYAGKKNYGGAIFKVLAAELFLEAFFDENKN